MSPPSILSHCIICKCIFFFYFSLSTVRKAVVDGLFRPLQWRLAQRSRCHRVHSEMQLKPITITHCSCFFPAQLFTLIVFLWERLLKSQFFSWLKEKEGGVLNVPVVYGSAPNMPPERFCWNYLLLDMFWFYLYALINLVYCENGYLLCCERKHWQTVKHESTL